MVLMVEIMAVHLHLSREASILQMRVHRANFAVERPFLRIISHSSVLHLNSVDTCIIKVRICIHCSAPSFKCTDLKEV